MVVSHPFKLLGDTPIDAFVDFFCTHELPWKIVSNPYSKRQTLPMRWCPKNLVDGKLKIIQLEQHDGLEQLTNYALSELQIHVPCFPVRVFYAKLMPGDSILSHTDIGFIFKVSRRCHLPIQAPVGIEFKCGVEVYSPKKGQWFEINNCLPHSVTNKASSARIHLIVDTLDPGHEHLIVDTLDPGHEHLLDQC